LFFSLLKHCKLIYSARYFNNNRYTSRISIFQQYLHTLFVCNRLELVHEVSNPKSNKLHKKLLYTNKTT
jgi:hypothetical protein